MDQVNFGVGAKMKDKLKLATFYAAIALSIVVGGCTSAWDCTRNGAGVTCYRVMYEPD